MVVEEKRPGVEDSALEQLHRESRALGDDNTRLRRQIEREREEREEELTRLRVRTRHDKLAVDYLLQVLGEYVPKATLSHVRLSIEAQVKERIEREERERGRQTESGNAEGS